MYLTMFRLNILGLCTAAVEWQELHEDNTFTLNSGILQCSQLVELIPFMWPILFHNDEHCMVLVVTYHGVVVLSTMMPLNSGVWKLDALYFLNSLLSPYSLAMKQMKVRARNGPDTVWNPEPRRANASLALAAAPRPAASCKVTCNCCHGNKPTFLSTVLRRDHHHVPQVSQM